MEFFRRIFWGRKEARIESREKEKEKIMEEGERREQGKWIGLGILFCDSFLDFIL